MLADSSRAMLEAIADPAIVIGAAKRVEWANASAHRRFGREGLDRVLDASPAAGETATVSLLDAAGETFQAELRIAPAGDDLQLLTVRDVTAEHRIASQLADAERIGRIGIWAWDMVTGEVTWSDEAFRLFGVDPSESPTFEKWLAVMHPEDRDQVQTQIQDAIANGGQYDFFHRVPRADGTTTHLHCRGQVIFGLGGDPSGIVGVSQDVTEEVHRQAELARIGAQREAILDAAGEGVCGLDPNGLVTFANPAAARILGTTVEEIVGSPFSIRLARMANGSLVPDALIDRIREGEPLRDDNACLRRADGGEVPAGLMCTPLWDADRIAGAVATFDDATSRKQFEAQLQYLADHDPLTGLQNRRRFEDTTQELCTYSARYGAQLSMLLLDLDHFKDVNDTKGHAVGDGLLRSIATLLRQSLREGDALARLGGDEFAVLLPATDEQSAIAVAESLRAAVGSHTLLAGGHALRITASIGVAGCCKSSDDGESLLADADVAMYDAKDAGRNQVAVYRADRGGRARMEARLTWTRRLRRAIDRDELILFAQPIRDLSERLEPRFEVLVRLALEDGTLAPPGAFIPTAERYGLMGEIDRAVVRQSIAIAAAQKGAGNFVRLEVNLSGRSMVDPELPAFISQHLDACGADPSQLIFEVTETAAIDNLQAATALATQLSALGCGFALDDFGAGFSSFVYLKHLPVDYIKVDGDFIRGLVANPTDQLIVQSIVTLAHGMGKRTIAECVEDVATVEMLRNFGVDFVQGFHIGEPGLIEDVLPRLSPEPRYTPRSAAVTGA